MMSEATSPETNPVTDPEPRHTDEEAVVAPRSGPDLFSLVVGLGSLGLAATGLLGGIDWLPDVDGRWILAALALFVGLLLVVGSLRAPRH